MTGIEWKKMETVGVITMNNGENRQNPDFVRAVLAAFDEIERDSEISSVIISSSDPKNWSLGIDLQWMSEAMGENNLKKRMHGRILEIMEKEDPAFIEPLHLLL